MNPCSTDHCKFVVLDGSHAKHKRNSILIFFANVVLTLKIVEHFIFLLFLYMYSEMYTKGSVIT